MKMTTIKGGEPVGLTSHGILSKINSITYLAEKIDNAIERLGRVTSWLTLLLVLLVAGDVLFRYIWHVSSVAEQEFEWHVLAVISMFSASYTLQQGDHVRVDIFYQHFSLRLKRWMDILTPALVIVPSMLFIAWLSLGFVSMSLDTMEGSPDPGGLPARYLIKAFLPLGFFLVALQGIAMTLQGIAKLNATEKNTHG
jgi:TRAP-type mannitol/chloroaromatic compound transport system permease small subunit